MVNLFKKSGQKAHILCQISGKISLILEKNQGNFFSKFGTNPEIKEWKRSCFCKISVKKEKGLPLEKSFFGCVISSLTL